MNRQVELLLKDAQSIEDYCAAVAFAHARMVFTQPCEEANKRCARILTWAHLRTVLELKERPGPWSFAIDEYIEALQTAGMENDLGPLARIVAALLPPHVSAVHLPATIPARFRVQSGAFQPEQSLDYNMQASLLPKDRGNLLSRSRSFSAEES